MKYFLYKMQSDGLPPGGGDFRSWLHYYKWGRPETVTFLKPTPYFKAAERGDVLFFVLDGFLIGDALIDDVRDDMPTFGDHYQEIDVANKGIWEYLRPWGLWDRLLDKLRLSGLKDEVPPVVAAHWLREHRDLDVHVFGGWETKGRSAVYREGVEPPFFKIKKR